MVKKLSRDEGRTVIEAIKAAEKMTSGEIRVHITKKCKSNVYAEAQKVFNRLRMHRTKERNAVLIFVALESRQFAILGDSGIHRHVGDSFWDQTRDKMISCFSKDQIKEGVVAGVLNVGEKLKAYFPSAENDSNELSNKITEG